MSRPVTAAKARAGAIQARCGIAERSLLGFAGALFALVGAGLAIASAFVAGGRSTFFVVIGLGLIVAGALLARRLKAGGWAYMVVVGVTVIWSLHNAQTGGSSLAYRFVGPVILFVMIALLAPVLRRCNCRVARRAEPASARSTQDPIIGVQS